MLFKSQPKNPLRYDPFRQEGHLIMLETLKLPFAAAALAIAAFSQPATPPADITALVAKIQDSVSKSDFKNASLLTFTLQGRLTEEMVKVMPSAQERLARAEAISPYRGSDPNALTGRLLFLPKLSFDAGEFAKARTYADSLLEAAGAAGVASNLYGTAMTEGHTVKGKLALRNGDINTANDELVKSVQLTTSTATVAKVGCDFDLASALLAKEQRAAVVQFLQYCQALNAPFPISKSQYDVWIAAIEGGATPALSKQAR